MYSANEEERQLVLELWGHWAFYSYMIFFQHPAICTSADSIVPGRRPCPILESFDAYVIISSGKFKNQGQDESRPQIASVHVHLSGAVENEGYGTSAYRAVVIEERWRATGNRRGRRTWGISSPWAGSFYDNELWNRDRVCMLLTCKET